jgi:hypothetical protein
VKRTKTSPPRTAISSPDHGGRTDFSGGSAVVEDVAGRPAAAAACDEDDSDIQSKVILDRTTCGGGTRR